MWTPFTGNIRQGAISGRSVQGSETELLAGSDLKPALNPKALPPPPSRGTPEPRPDWPLGVREGGSPNGMKLNDFGKFEPR
jgi:hypothetical protein